MNPNIKTKWIENQLQQFPKADKQVLKFIADIVYHSGDGKPTETITHLFTAGYCYYFALMLQTAFQRGTICYAYYEGHIVWLDGTSQEKDIAYDIWGVNKRWEYLIPIEKIRNGIWDFMHVSGKQSEMEDQEIIKLLLDIIENKEYAI